MNNTAKQTAQTASDLAQKIARQMAQEPLEILKTAGEQATGVEVSGHPDSGQPDNSDGQQKKLEEQQKLQDHLKSVRRMETFQRELTDIRKQDLFKDLQNKIAQGIEIPLEDYLELSMEQKQVLKAQMEAVRNQKTKQLDSQAARQLIEPVSKKGRRFGSSQKQEAEKQQTRVEKPVPPSG